MGFVFFLSRIPLAHTPPCQWLPAGNINHHFNSTVEETHSYLLSKRSVAADSATKTSQNLR